MDIHAPITSARNPALPYYGILRPWHALLRTRFTNIDLGGGSLMLVPRRLRVDALAEPLLDSLSARGESLESLLAHLDAQRGRPSDYDAGGA